VRVCLLLGGNEEGGLEQHFIHLANELARTSQQVEVYVIAHGKYRNRFTDLIHFVALPLNQSRRNPWLLLRLILSINKISPDVIHAHANKATALLATIKSMVPGKKVATLHSQKKNLRMYQKMDLVIGVSNNVLKKLRKVETKVIYNSLPKCFIQSSKIPLSKAALNIHNDKLIVVFVGRLVAVKGVDILLQAWKNVDANLLLIGEGEDFSHLKKIIDDDLEISNVQFLGFRNDVAAILDIADLTVVSSYREGFCYVVAESLFMRTPIVSTNVPIANEVLPSKYIVTPGHVSELHDTIVETLQHLAEAELDFLPLYEFARESFNEEAMIKSLMGSYEKLMNR